MWNRARKDSAKAAMVSGRSQAAVRELHHVQPTVKIRSEVAILQGGLEIAVRGRNDADTRADQLTSSTDSFEPEIL